MQKPLVRSAVAWVLMLPSIWAALAAVGYGADAADACRVTSRGTKVLTVRPAPDEPVVDDVNWFARPVPNRAGRWIVGFASHDRNYLYDLTRGRRVRIPDRSDAVATPDGRYVTVPSHYTATRTVNFYDADLLLARLDAGQDADDVPPAFADDSAEVADVFYQSVGVLSDRREGSRTTTVYRMMFSGSNVAPAPGFRIVDYTFVKDGGQLRVTASRPMRLCPQIARDLSTPFISKDGRHVIAHDGGSATEPGTLKIFEIMSLDPGQQTTNCEQRVDFGFAAGKADFSFDGTRVTFHISKHAYLTPFVNGGLNAPAITDVVVADLVRDRKGRIVGHRGLSRVTTSTVEGVGSYFPAFFPDGRVFYIANSVARNAEPSVPRRFSFHVVDASAEVRVANFFTDATVRAAAERIGEAWRERCAPDLQPFKPGEAGWAFLSLTRPQCEALARGLPGGDRGQAGIAGAASTCRVLRGR